MDDNTKKKNVSAKKTDKKPKPTQKPKPEKKQEEKTAQVSEQQPVKEEPQVKELPQNPTGGISDFFQNFNFKIVIDTFSDLVTNCKKTIEIIKDTLTNANEFFEKVKQENFNKSLGFFVLFLGVMAVFGFINMLVLGAPVQAVGALFMMIIVTPIFYLLFVAVATFVLRLFGAKGTFIDTCKVASYVSWLGTISSFPLFFMLGATVMSLASIVVWALSTYIWIKGAIIVLEMDKDRAIMLIGGLFILACLLKIIL